MLAIAQFLASYTVQYAQMHICLEFPIEVKDRVPRMQLKLFCSNNHEQVSSINHLTLFHTEGGGIILKFRTS